MKTVHRYFKSASESLCLQYTVCWVLYVHLQCSIRCSCNLSVFLFQSVAHVCPVRCSNCVKLHGKFRTKLKTENYRIDKLIKLRENSSFSVGRTSEGAIFPKVFPTAWTKINLQEIGISNQLIKNKPMSMVFPLGSSSSLIHDTNKMNIPEIWTDLVKYIYTSSDVYFHFLPYTTPSDNGSVSCTYMCEYPYISFIYSI